ncbi:MAG: MsnO8 family LLM class oxidoreductase, partial [Brevundimonas sp.]
VPGHGSRVPVWLLGSSLFSAELAGHLGLPYAFASHFAPEMLMEALEIYRSRFRPSARLAKPYAMAAINVFAADTDAEANRIATTMMQSFAAVVRGRPGLVPPPVDDINAVLTPSEQAAVSSRLKYSAIGGKETVRERIAQFITQTGVDELMVTGMMFDLKDRVRSLEITAEVRADLGRAQAA